MGGYCSAPDVPLSLPFVSSLSNKRLIVSLITIRSYVVLCQFLNCFPSFLFDCVIRLSVFFWFSVKYGRSSQFLRNVPSQFEVLKVEILEHSDPRFHNKFVINVTDALLLLAGGFGSVNPAEWHILPGQSP